MTYQWQNYPEWAPTDSGYYYTVHVMNGQRLYKAIWWSSETNKWVHWRPAEYRAGVSPDVLVFVVESRTDYYCPCMIGVQENLEHYTPYDGI